MESVARKRLKKCESPQETVATTDEDLGFVICTKPDDKSGVCLKSHSSNNGSSSEAPIVTTERVLEQFLFGKVGSADDKVQISSESDSSEDEEACDKPISRRRRPAWLDEDDNRVLVKDVVATYSKAAGKHGQKETSSAKYSELLRSKFSALTSEPRWANLDVVNNDDVSSDEEFFKETTDILDKKSKQAVLARDTLHFKKVKDINHSSHCEGSVIRSTEFHPSATVGMVAGINGTVSLFQIDGSDNPKMQTINFENFPIRTAHFSADGTKVIAGSNHFNHFFVYDMYKGKVSKVPWKGDSSNQCNTNAFEVSPCGDFVALQGRFGFINILSSKSLASLFTFKMNDEVTAMAFSPDGYRLYSHGASGEVYVWDLKSQECIHRFWDDGCVKGTALAVAPNDAFVATGSSSGVVNIYRRSELMSSSRPKPEKAVLNLTTAITSLAFNPSSEILAFASEYQENAIRLLHVTSMTVFSNFPGQRHNLKMVNCLNFSLNGGYLSIGNNRGAANLYRLNHYTNF